MNKFIPKAFFTLSLFAPVFPFCVTASATAYISPSDTVTQNKLKRDTEISWAVKNAIATDNRFLAFADDIHVETKDGVVTLSGIVDFQKTKSDIEVTVKSITGVKRVINNIQLKKSIP